MGGYPIDYKWGDIKLMINPQAQPSTDKIVSRLTEDGWKKKEENIPQDSVQLWLSAVPTSAENLAFSQEKIKISLGIRIGLKNCLASWIRRPGGVVVLWSVSMPLDCPSRVRILASMGCKKQNKIRMPSRITGQKISQHCACLRHTVYPYTEAFDLVSHAP